MVMWHSLSTYFPWPNLVFSISIYRNISFLLQYCIWFWLSYQNRLNFGFVVVVVVSFICGCIPNLKCLCVWVSHANPNFFWVYLMFLIHVKCLKNLKLTNTMFVIFVITCWFFDIAINFLRCFYELHFDICCLLG